MSILKKYYAKRASEYEEAYHQEDPLRGKELAEIAKALKREFTGRDVLELACGTGYWTQILSETAKSITAIDAVQEVLDLAKIKKYNCPVTLQIADAYKLPFKKAFFDAVLANFWFSHIPKDKIDSFLEAVHKLLKPGSKVFMADDVYVEGSGGPLVVKSGDKNTYKLRTLKDGSKHIILKNYFTQKQLRTIFKKYAHNFSFKNIFYGKRFWYLIYEI